MWSNRRMNEIRSESEMNLAAQAQIVLGNAAYKRCIADLVDESLYKLFSADSNDAEAVRVARIKYDAAVAVGAELESKLRSHMSPRGM